MNQLTSKVLLGDDRMLLAFGQYYRRLDRCHLGRQAVSPSHRGEGIPAMLMQRLIDDGAKALAATEASLFVLADNAPAVQAYQRFGFVEESYPTELPLPGCLYLVKPVK